MFTRNPYFSEFKRISMLLPKHGAQDFVREVGLQLADKATMNAHSDNGHESGFFEFPALFNDLVEMVIDAVETTVGFDLSAMMESSQFAPPCRLVRVRSVLKSPGVTRWLWFYFLARFARSLMYRVFLPFSIFGRISRTLSMSFSVHECT